MLRNQSRKIAGLIAFGTCLAATCVFAYWGTCEAFHEGWTSNSLPGNILITLRYLIPCLIFIAIGTCAVLLPRIVGVICAIMGLTLLAWWIQACWPIRPFFFANILTQGIIALIFMGALFFRAEFQWHKNAILLITAAPALIFAACAAEPISRIMTRIDDGILSARVIKGNGVTLMWAPLGPGWPTKGCSWKEAYDACRRLSEDGLHLENAPVDIWRLPTLDEAVRSMTRAGTNAGGVLDEKMTPSYTRNPDKETPLWAPTSSVIYLWTATEAPENRAYFVAANGYVRTRPKDLAMGSNAFRAVKNIPAQAEVKP